MWRWSELWLELEDAGVAAPEGGLRGRLFGERRGSGGGFSPWSCGWRGEGDGRLRCWRRFGFGNPRSRVGSLSWGQRAWRMPGSVRRFFRAKALCLGTIGGDACGYRYLLGGVDAATFR